PAIITPEMAQDKPRGLLRPFTASAFAIDPGLPAVAGVVVVGDDPRVLGNGRGQGTVVRLGAGGALVGQRFRRHWRTAHPEMSRGAAVAQLAAGVLHRL